MATVAEKPLVVIAGPTASGKSSLAMELAEQFNGEIICADSRTIYKFMDIGTAKPSAEDQARVPHWGLDLVEPGEPFSAADFKDYADEKIADIRARGRVPFLVGGTGLYVDAVIFDYQFGPTPDPQKRAEFEAMSLAQLHQYCIENNISLPENEQNKRYVIRAIEQKSINTKRLEYPLPNTVVVGIATDKDILRQRIEKRAEQLFANGMVEEASSLGERFGWESEAMTGNIYRLVRQYLRGEFDAEELKRRNATADWQLAKRQLTWLKRNPFMQWKTLDEAKKYISDQLAK